MKMFCFFTLSLFLCVLPVLAETAALAVAVVDVQKVADQYEKSIVLEKEMREKGLKMQEDLANMEMEMKKLGDSVQIAGAARAEEIKNKMQEMEIAYNVNKRRYQEEHTNQMRKHLLTIFSDIKAAISDYSAEKKIDLVLRKAEGEEGDVQSQMMDMQMGLVLYNRDAMDISEEIAKLLNAKYEQEKN